MAKAFTAMVLSWDWVWYIFQDVWYFCPISIHLFFFDLYVIYLKGFYCFPEFFNLGVRYLLVSCTFTVAFNYIKLVTTAFTYFHGHVDSLIRTIAHLFHLNLSGASML